MLMHEWLKHRGQKVEKAERKPPAEEQEEELAPAADELPAPLAEAGAAEEGDEHYADAQRIASEVSKRAAEAQSSRLQALIARQQRLPLEVALAKSAPPQDRGPAKESREQLIERLLDPTLTLSETAALLGVCPTTVRRYTKRGVLNCFRTPGNQRRFKLSDVLNFMEQQRE